VIGYFDEQSIKIFVYKRNYKVLDSDVEAAKTLRIVGHDCVGGGTDIGLLGRGGD
jgi:hypothetical protein